MVRAGVSFHHKTNIVFIDGNLTAAHHQTGVLDTGVIPLLKNTEECSCYTMVPQPIGQGPLLHI